MKGASNELNTQANNSILYSFYKKSATTANTYLIAGRAGGGTTKTKRFLSQCIYPTNQSIFTYLTNELLTNVNNTFHTFIVFDYSTKYIDLSHYSETGTLLATANTGPLPSDRGATFDTILDPFDGYELAIIPYNRTVCSYVTIYNAGWYNRTLNRDEMNSIVKLSNLN